MRKVVHWIASACVLTCVAARAEGDVWSGVGLILKGANVGMSLPDFLKNHPRAYNSDIAAVNKPVDRAAKDISLEERFDKDPFLGLWCLANYGFKNGALYEFTLLWYDREDKVMALRDDFFKACVKRHGADFRQDAMKVNSGAPDEHLAPVLVWMAGEAACLASYSTTKDDKKGPQGAFTYALFPKQDPFLDSQLVGKTLKPDELKRVYAGIESILDKAAKRYSEHKK